MPTEQHHSGSWVGVGLTAASKQPWALSWRAHYLPGERECAFKTISQIHHYSCERCWVKGRKLGTWKWVRWVLGEWDLKDTTLLVPCIRLTPAAACAVRSGTPAPPAVGLSWEVTHSRRPGQSLCSAFGGWHVVHSCIVWNQNPGSQNKRDILTNLSLQHLNYFNRGFE